MIKSFLQLELVYLMKLTALTTFILSILTASLYAGENVTTSTTAQTEQTSAKVNDFKQLSKLSAKGNMKKFKKLDNLQSLVHKNTGDTLLHIATARSAG